MNGIVIWCDRETGVAAKWEDGVGYVLETAPKPYPRPGDPPLGLRLPGFARAAAVIAAARRASAARRRTTGLSPAMPEVAMGPYEMPLFRTARRA